MIKNTEDDEDYDYYLNSVNKIYAKQKNYQIILVLFLLTQKYQYHLRLKW